MTVVRRLRVPDASLHRLALVLTVAAVATTACRGQSSAAARDAGVLDTPDRAALTDDTPEALRDAEVFTSTDRVSPMDIASIRDSPDIVEAGARDTGTDSPDAAQRDVTVAGDSSADVTLPTTDSPEASVDVGCPSDSDVLTDPNNCGACGVRCCPGSAWCFDGHCRGEGGGPGLVACPLSMPGCTGFTAGVDLMTNHDHCGTCETACGPGQRCAGGSCH